MTAKSLSVYNYINRPFEGTAITNEAKLNFPFSMKSLPLIYTIIN